MSTASTYDDPTGRQHLRASWQPLTKEFWGGVSIVAIWLAVLFVGIFGGNIQSSDVSGQSESWPVVAVVAIAALFATVSIGHWAFRQRGVDEDLRRVLEEEREALAQLDAQLEALRTRLPQT